MRLPARCRTARVSRLSGRIEALARRHVAAAAWLVLAPLAPLSAQLRGGGPVRVSGTPSWWVSGGVSATSIGTISDGRSGSTWTFDGDPRFLVRGTIEKTLQPTTTIGLGVSWGTSDLRYAPLAGAPVADLLPGTPAELGACFAAGGCAALADLFAAQLVLRGGGAREGVHQILEVTGGVSGYRNFRTKASALPLTVKDAIDVNAGLGYGIGYAFGPDFHVGLVQDIGIAWHSGAELPDDVGRTYRLRNTRVTIRYGFGTLR